MKSFKPTAAALMLAAGLVAPLQAHACALCAIVPVITSTIDYLNARATAAEQAALLAAGAPPAVAGASPVAAPTPRPRPSAGAAVPALTAAGPHAQRESVAGPMVVAPESTVRPRVVPLAPDVGNLPIGGFAVFAVYRPVAEPVVPAEPPQLWIKR